MIRFVIALAAGLAFAFLAPTVHAQDKSPVYVFVELNTITDADAFKALPAKATPEWLARYHGKYVIRSNNIVAVDGTPPKRIVVIQFDTMDDAKAWRASPETKEVDATRAKAAQSREFMATGM